MNKYYVIKMAYDSGFWSEEHQDFKGWLYATKYNQNPFEIQAHYDMGNGIICIKSGVEAKRAAQKKPITILEIYDHE